MANGAGREEMVRRVVAGRKWLRENGREEAVHKLLEYLKTAPQDEPWVGRTRNELRACLHYWQELAVARK